VRHRTAEKKYNNSSTTTVELLAKFAQLPVSNNAKMSNNTWFRIVVVLKYEQRTNDE